MKSKKKEQIESAALKLFTEKGFRETTLNDIVTEADVSLATIYKHFKNKQELFEGLSIPELKYLRPQYERKKQEIVNTALMLFGEKGYNETSLDEIAKVCGFTRANLYQYFTSKEELFKEIIQQGKVLLQLNEMFQGNHKDIKEDLSLLAHAFLDTITEPERLNLFRLTIAESPKFPEAGKALYDNAIDKANSQLGQYLSQRQLAGTIPNFDAKFAARLFLGTLLSFFVVDYLIYPGKPEYSRNDIVDNAVAFFLNAIKDGQKY